MRWACCTELSKGKKVKCKTEQRQALCLQAFIALLSGARACAVKGASIRQNTATIAAAQQQQAAAALGPSRCTNSHRHRHHVTSPPSSSPSNNTRCTDHFTGSLANEKLYTYICCVREEGRRQRGSFGVGRCSCLIYRFSRPAVRRFFFQVVCPAPRFLARVRFRLDRKEGEAAHAHKIHP